MYCAGRSGGAGGTQDLTQLALGDNTMKIEMIESHNRYQRAADNTKRADRKAREQAGKESVQNQVRLPRVRRAARRCDTGKVEEI
jgi:hypothetical protein